MGAQLLLYRALPVLLIAACGGGGAKTAKKPKPTKDDTAEATPPKVETEEDRAKKRRAASFAIVPEGSKCLPATLKEDGAPRLELTALGTDAVVCAIDVDKSRLLGPVGCWKVDLSSGALAYQDPAPMPGRNIDASVDDSCARGYCDGKLAGNKIAHMSWSYPDQSKVAVLAGDLVTVFDAAGKAKDFSFSVKGDKGVSGDADAVYFVGDAVFVRATDSGVSAVWQFKTDGTASGPLVGIGKDDKPISIHHGSFSVLDKDHIGLSEHALSTLTNYEISSGKRTKAVRKIGKVACKPDELDAYWKDGEKVSEKCKGSAASQFAVFDGATAVMGSKSLLVMLRDDRLGELAVMDPKSLAEKKAIKMPWCEGGAEGGDKKSADDAKDKEAPPSKTRGAKTKTGDPDEGGQ